MLLPVSILGSSSGSTFCSLLKLYVKKLAILFKYFGDVAAYRFYVYMLYVLQGGRAVDRPPYLPATHKHIHIQTICCHITETFKQNNQLFNI